MSTCGFFQEGSDQSLVKSAIVSKYFWAWAKVMIANIKRYERNEKIAYIDLFAGPGRYDDGTQSTPLLILSKVLDDADMCKHLVTLFNDGDDTHSQSLEGAIKNLQGIEKMKHHPTVYNEEVGDNIVKMFEEMKLVPTFFFVDPWGYKGLSLRLVNSVLKDWGCDCVFSFNYNRINMGLTNPLVKGHMDALFGEERADTLSTTLKTMTPEEREATIVNELAIALKDYGDERYVLPFCFKDNQGKRTKHHLIFVSKNFKGYEIMKEIMAKESAEKVEGVCSFTYFPAKPKQAMLFPLTRPIEDLKEILLDSFAGQSLTIDQIYEQHSVGTPYIKPNYRQVLIELEEDKKISVRDPQQKTRRKNTFPPRLIATFPQANL